MHFQSVVYRCGQNQLYIVMFKLCSFKARIYRVHFWLMMTITHIYHN